MKTMIKEFNGFIIKKNINSHCALIYKGGDLVKCIVGDIFDNNTDNSVSKSKQWILLNK